MRRAAFPLSSVKWEAFAFIFQTLHELAKNYLRESLYDLNKKPPKDAFPSFFSSKGGATPILVKSEGDRRGGKGLCLFWEEGFIYFFSWENTFWPGKNEQNDNLSWSS